MKKGAPSDKSNQNLSQKGRSPFLFYKFYKFRACNTLIFNKFRRLRQEIATEKQEIATKLQG